MGLLTIPVIILIIYGIRYLHVKIQKEKNMQRFQYKENKKKEDIDNEN